MRNFNEVFGKDLPYDNIKSHKKAGVYPLFRKYSFRITTGQGQIDSPPPHPASLLRVNASLIILFYKSFYKHVLNSFIHIVVDKSTLFADKSTLFVDKSILFVDKSILFDDKNILFVDKSIPFVDKSILFVDKSILFVDKSILFVDISILFVDNIVFDKNIVVEIVLFFFFFFFFYAGIRVLKLNFRHEDNTVS